MRTERISHKGLNKKRMILVAALSTIGIFFLIVLIPSLKVESVSTSSFITSTESINSVSRPVGQEEERSVIPPEQIVSGGPPADGIPPIDKPKFVQLQKAEEFLEDSDLLVGLNIKGDVRAYPLQILVWHEIVNDRVGGVPVAVTYCPLCFTNQVFNRTMNDGQLLEFGTSGKLYNSNLVMYDRTTKSLWSQAMAQGIAGKLAGVKLERIPFDVAYWKEWKQLYPDSKVLSTDTGSTRPYGADPYGDYYTNEDVLFPVSSSDDRLGQKEIVIGLENKGQYEAFKLQDVEDKKVINDQVNGKPIVFFSLHPFMARIYDPVVDGQILEFNYNMKDKNFVDKQTGSMWNYEGKAISGLMKGKHLTRLSFDEGFWFEWVAFHPKTELYVGSNNGLKSAG